MNSLGTITIINAKVIHILDSDDKWLYIFGNNLLLIRMNCRTYALDIVTSQIDKNDIDVRDSNELDNNYLKNNIIDSSIYDIDAFDNHTLAFSTKNCLFVYDFK